VPRFFSLGKRIGIIIDYVSTGKGKGKEKEKRERKIKMVLMHYVIYLVKRNIYYV